MCEKTIPQLITVIVLVGIINKAVRRIAQKWTKNELKRVLDALNKEKV